MIIYSITQTTKEIGEAKSAFMGITKQYTVDGEGGIDPTTFMNTVKLPVVNLLSQSRQTTVPFVLNCEMERVFLLTGEVIIDVFSSNREAVVILELTDLSEVYDNVKDTILEIKAFQMRGSNWRFKSFMNKGMNYFVYNRPLKGSSYIPLPAELLIKKAIINMKFEANERFKWSIARALMSADEHSE